MTELQAIDYIRRRAAGSAAKGLILGIGDDCAILRPRAGEDLLFTTDQMVEDVHFRQSTHPPEAVGHKALARGLSDIAAMGGEPRFCLVSLAGPLTEDWLEGFYDGLLALAHRTHTALAGGDLARSALFTCDIVVCGAVSKGTALRRDGARPGDLLYVSGRLGGSALGLQTRTGAAWRRHLRPEPRLALGDAVRKLGATAAIDLSDGLSIDLHRLCAASMVGAKLDRDPPLFPGATLDQALHGGEDYELLFTLPPNVKPPRGVTRIGRIVEGEARGPLPLRGYDHFRTS
jgi:thiamine-monophosphate kinase